MKNYRNIQFATTAAILCIYAIVWQLRAQTTVNASATIQFANGETASVTDFSNPITVQPNEVVTPAPGVGCSEALAKETPMTLIGSDVKIPSYLGRCRSCYCLLYG